MIPPHRDQMAIAIHIKSGHARLGYIADDGGYMEFDLSPGDILDSIDLVNTTHWFYPLTDSVEFLRVPKDGATENPNGVVYLDEGLYIE